MTISTAGLATALLLSACALSHASRAPARPSAPEAWPRASAVAAEQVAAGRYAAADRWLADFAVEYAGTSEAALATVRRAIYMADPANQTSTAHAATALLDSTLTTSLDSATRADVRAVRRIALALERAATGTSSGSNAGTAGTPSSSASENSSTRPEDSKARDEEIQRLRSELAKANAELERIKKRVAQPKP
jgi:hypothetical protein